MTTQQITIELPPYGRASLTLPERLTPDAFARLDAAISQALREPCRNNRTDAPSDPGAIEFASWRIDQH